MAETNAQRKKRRVVSNTELEDVAQPALPPSVVEGADFFRPTPSTSVLSEFGRGVGSGARTVEGLQQGFTGAVAGSLGFEDEARKRLALQEEREIAAQVNAPRIERVQDVTNLKDAADFVAGIAGKQGVIFAPIVGAAAAGAVASPLLPVTAATAAATGAVGTGIGLEAGDAFSNIAGDPESVENLGFQGASLTALGTGTVAGALEVVPALAAVKRVGLLKPFQRAVRSRLSERVAKGALSQAGIEGLTEGAQTIIQRAGAKFANENREILGEEGFDELINSIVTGTIFGFGVGGITGAVGGRGPQKGSVDDQIDLEDSLDELDFAGGRSSDIETDIDDSEFGQDIRDARLRPSLRRIGETPGDVIEELLARSREEGGLDRIPQSRMLAAIRELVDPEEQLTDLLIAQGVPDAPGTAAVLIERAGLEQAEDLEEQAIAASEGEIVEQATDDFPEGAELGTSEDDPSTPQFTTAEGFSDVNVTQNFILRTSNGTLGFVPPQKEGQENSLRTAINKMRKDFPDTKFDEFGLGDAVKQELDRQVRNDPVELNRILNDVAAEKLLESNFNAERFGEPDPADPAAFLNQFKVIRREEVASIFTGKNILRITDRDIFGGPGKGVVTPSDVGTSVQQPKSKPLVVDRLPNREGDLVVSVDVTKQKKDVNGKLILKDGKPITIKVKENRTLDAIKLTNLMLTKLEKLLPAAETKIRTVDNVANAFFNGLAGLASRNIIIDPANLRADMIVSKKGGFDITWGEISTQGAGRIRARIASFKAESKRLQEDIQEQIEKINRAKTPEKARRAKFILKKFKRRTKKIPSDIETMVLFGEAGKRDVAALQGKISTAVEQLEATRVLNEELQDQDALEAAEAVELDNFEELAVEIDNLVFNLRREGVSTIPVEELADAAQQMQEIVDAGKAERTRIFRQQEPEGAESFEESEKSQQLVAFEERELQRIRKKLFERLKRSENTTGARLMDNTLPSKAAVKRVRKKHKEWTKRFDLETTILIDLEEVKEHLTETMLDEGGDRAVEGAATWEKMMNGTVDGVYDLDTDTIVMNPIMNNENFMMEAVAHEVGHAIFAKHMQATAKKGSKTTLNTPEIAAMRKEWLAWRLEHNLPDLDAAAIVAGKQPFFTAMERVMMGEMKDLSELTKERQTYILDFEEWFADQVSQKLTRTELSKADLKSVAAKAFKGIADDLIDLFKRLIDATNGFKPAESVSEFLDSIVHDQDEVQVLSKEFSKLLKTANLPSDTPAVAGVMMALDPFGKSTPWMLRKAFTQVLEEGERRTLFQFFSRASQKRRLKELAGNDAQRDLIESSPLHAAVFGYQMWMAGEFTIKSQSRRILQDQAGVSQEEVAGPVSQFVLDMFTKIFDTLSSIFGVIHADQQAEQLLVAIREGYIDQRKTGQRRWAVNTQLRDTLLQRIGGTFNAGFEHLKPFFERALMVADQRLLESGIPGLLKIARGYHAAVGQENLPKTFFEARQIEIGKFLTSYTRLTAELREDAGLKADVLAAMRNPKKANRDPDVARISAALFKFNRRFRNYLVDAGLEVGDRGPRYFPWVYDPRKVQDNTDFINDLLMDTRFDKEVNQWLRRRNDEIIAYNLAKEKGVPEQPLITRQELVDEVVLSLQQNEGYADTELNPRQTGTTPWFASMHQRALGFLTKEGGLTKAERERFDGLFSDQMDLVMMTYVRQGVKRAEYARRFGTRSEKLQQFIAEARAEGASTEDMRAAYQYIDAMNGVLGEGTNQRIAKLLKLGARRGEVINPHYRTFTSLMMVIQNMAVLPLATLTSLVDPVGIMVRSQDMNATMAALRTGAKEIAAEIKNITGNDPDANRTELRKLAEGMGVIEDHMTNEALEWEYGSTYLTPRLKAANEFFFKAIGLTQWTRVTRIMALAGGKEFIKRHVQRPNGNSDRFMRQLALAPEDVKFDENGDIKILSRMERESDGGLRVSDEEIARDDRVRNALNRFVNESILRPNAAQRPIWASDPNYALVFHLKSFMFSFHDRILRRAFQEAALGNVAPLVLLTAFVPAMLFADILRDMIQFGLDGNPRKASWGLEDHIWNATQRSGLNGIGQLLIDGKQDIQFGGFGYESLIGPTADGITDLGGLFSDDNEAQWRAFQRNLPGNSAWKHWIENGLDEQPAFQDQ